MGGRFTIPCIWEILIWLIFPETGNRSRRSPHSSFLTGNRSRRSPHSSFLTANLLHWCFARRAGYLACTWGQNCIDIIVANTRGKRPCCRPRSKCSMIQKLSSGVLSRGVFGIPEVLQWHLTSRDCFHLKLTTKNWYCLYPQFDLRLEIGTYQYYRGADKSLARPDWKNNWKVVIFRPTRRSLLPRRPGWMDTLLNFSLNGFQKLEFGRCSWFSSWSG